MTGKEEVKTDLEEEVKTELVYNHHERLWREFATYPPVYIAIHAAFGCFLILSLKYIYNEMKKWSTLVSEFRINNTRENSKSCCRSLYMGSLLGPNTFNVYL